MRDSFFSQRFTKREYLEPKCTRQAEPSRTAADLPPLITLVKTKYLFESHLDNMFAISHCYLICQITKGEKVKQYNKVKCNETELNLLI